MTKKTDHCGICKFFETGENYDSNHGECHRFPPQVTLNVNGVPMYHWPTMTVDDWCGEFKKK